MAHLLDEDLLPPDCPVGGVSAQRVWDALRELQYAYQEREPGWETVPPRFEYLARGLHAVVLVGA